MLFARLTLSLIIIFFVGRSYATDCSVIEYFGRIEVICDNKREPNLNKTVHSKFITKTNEYRIIKGKKLLYGINNIRNDINRYIEYKSINNSFDTSNFSNIKVDAIHVQANRNKYLTATINCDVISYGSGNVMVDIIGKNTMGKQIDYTRLSGFVNAGEYAKLTATKEMLAEIYLNIRTWEVYRPSITTMLTSNSIFNEASADKKINEYISKLEILRSELGDLAGYIDVKILTNPANESVANDLPSLVSPQVTTVKELDKDIIMLLAKNGDVKFPHKVHKEILGNCSDCHENDYGGKINGFSKDIAHKICKGCHEKGKAGPTKCGECHRK